MVHTGHDVGMRQWPNFRAAVHSTVVLRVKDPRDEGSRITPTGTPMTQALNRRRFHQQALGLAAATLPVGAVSTAWAQAAPVEGRDFVKLAAPVPVTADGKVEVLEFFWYGCPHCHAFQPALETWAKRIPADVAFRRVPVAFTSMHETHAKLYYALEQINALETTHKRVFTAMHQQRMRLDKESDIVAFVTSAGVDAAKFTDAFRSFGVATKVRQSKQLADGYRIDGVPALGIHGRWYTAPSLVNGDHARALAVADHLIGRARKA